MADTGAGDSPPMRVVHSVRATRWEHGWELQVGDDGVTQCRTLAGAEATARDYLATMHGGEPDDYRVSLDKVSGEFRYLVRVEPAEGWWFLLVPEINHATQARFLGEADVMARDLIALTTGQVAADLKLDWDVTEAERLADSDPSRAEKSTTSPTGCPSSTGPARRSASSSSRPISRTANGAITQSRHVPRR